MPLHGYTAMFLTMISHKNIRHELRTSFIDVQQNTFDRLIFTGPIDEFFGYSFGALAYRSLRFEFETHEKDYVQPVAQVNYPNDYDFTRITEFKHITGQRNPKTTIAKEYSMEEGEPYYPIPQKEYCNFINATFPKRKNSQQSSLWEGLQRISPIIWIKSLHKL